MINSKQRAYLKSLANKMEPIFQIGKAGASPETVSAINEALQARELIKGTVLNNCPYDIKEVANIISERAHCEIVQIIGKKIILFRQNKKKPIIDINSVL